MKHTTLAQFCPDSLRPISVAEAERSAIRRAIIKAEMARVATAARENDARRLCFIFLTFLVITTLAAFKG